MTEKMRQFESGATRSSEEGKYDYEGFLSPLVLERYAQYMHENRVQADGELRDSDNWQKGMGMDCFMKSMWRHFMSLWKNHRGLPDSDSTETALCALLFNTMGYMHEYLGAEDRAKVEAEKDEGDERIRRAKTPMPICNCNPLGILRPCICTEESHYTHNLRAGLQEINEHNLADSQPFPRAPKECSCKTTSAIKPCDDPEEVMG
jgi:hypothetical protein